MHPLNPLVRKGKDGIWGSDVLPVMEWELAEARVVLSRSLFQRLQLRSPILRWSAAKHRAVVEAHEHDAHVIADLTNYLERWRFIGREIANPDLRRILLQDDDGRWYAVTVGELLSSENVITVFGSARANFLPNRLRGLLDAIERGNE